MNENNTQIDQEREAIQTKLAILRAAIEKMKTQPLEAISVRELCAVAAVTETAFYTYFKKKTDVLEYYFQITILEIAWYLRHAVKDKTNLELVEALFDFAARKVIGYPSMMSETIIYFARERRRPDFAALSKTEQALAFPNLPGIEQIQVQDTSLETLVAPYLQRAVEQGELPPQTDVPTVIRLIRTIFTGVVMNLHFTEPELICPLCRKHLQLLWKGLWAESKQC
jgi:AcrR family transcriptional regulator